MDETQQELGGIDNKSSRCDADTLTKPQTSSDYKVLQSEMDDVELSSSESNSVRGGGKLDDGANVDVDDDRLRETDGGGGHSDYLSSSSASVSPVRIKSQQRRPLSDLFLNQILIDRFKKDVKQRSPNNKKSVLVRRTRSDLGATSHSRISHTQHIKRKKPPDIDNDDDKSPIIIRRSFSQPVDIDQTTPLLSRKLYETSDYFELVHCPNRTTITVNEQSKTNEQMRSCVIRELVETERDYVKVLQNIYDAYICESRKRTDLFTNDQIETIFMNLEQILAFQQEFLADLESYIDWSNPGVSRISECFRKHSNTFRDLYSVYCNGYAASNSMLQSLYRISHVDGLIPDSDDGQTYVEFFETCRGMYDLLEIRLEGYLLAPVQRICKYPLQLHELLKYTAQEIESDYAQLRTTLDVMRGVAMAINEHKRRMENVSKLMAWQQRIEGWEGDDVTLLSSKLIHQGDVVRIKSAMWSNSITLFLFDHQLIYCKKDLLKRNTYVYKGRISTDSCRVTNVPHGKDSLLGVTVRHAIRIEFVSPTTSKKWLLFCCRSQKEKNDWLQSFERERRLAVTNSHDSTTITQQEVSTLAQASSSDSVSSSSSTSNSANIKHHSRKITFWLDKMINNSNSH